jgi:hypothetical protein
MAVSVTRLDPKPELSDVEVVRVAGEPELLRDIRDAALVETLEARFHDALLRNTRLQSLIQVLAARRLRFCVFGGWLRDHVSYARALPLVAPPRDIDLVVSGIDVRGLLEILPRDVKSTIFGGVQSGFGPDAFDIWPLHETFLIKYLDLRPTFESLLQTTDFNINAAIFFPAEGNNPPFVLDRGMFKALTTRTLSFNCACLPFPIMQCARLAAYAGKLSLNLSPAVRAFMLGVVADAGRRERVLFGVSENYPEMIAKRARQVLADLCEGRL